MEIKCHQCGKTAPWFYATGGGRFLCPACYDLLSRAEEAPGGVDPGGGNGCLAAVGIAAVAAILVLSCLLRWLFWGLR